ncbi:helix-turn-helix domain-containing protein [Pseudomonas nitroreducens]|uniref:helix-turn-helix domain-containing protein n=1 Tax=Pseudomonas nitroreducens TaxID=46680 RepID=UPI0020A0B02C|nr:helix-turn-helix transcriptional regulator [Pseudomonas nitroreducens]MCP1623617.1 transcriptional regulator with XRE-family HTH domain [Pseudomonas nitroreducens]
MEPKQAFGQALKALRTSKHLTQEDFSQVSSRTYLSTLERGLKSPTLEKVGSLAAVLDVHPMTLLAYTYLQLEREVDLEDLIARIRKDLADAALASGPEERHH